jgi:nucleotide-binding universal stress UspA family protein
MYRTIMVPLDGSSFSEHALPLALRAARLSDTALHLVCVSDSDQHRTDTTTIDTQPEHAYLARIADRLATSWHGPIETTLLDGSVTESIAAYTESHRVDLVVMTTHGRGALSRAWLGSVADRLIRRLPMPMVLVRPHENDPADSANPPRINHLLIPLDGSELSEQIVAHASALGRLTNAKYTLLQTIEILTPDYGIGIYPPTDFDIAAWMKAAQQYLDRIATGMRAEGLRVQTEVFVGAPALSILDYARDHAVDLIAIETHGRSGAARLLLGSIADKIVRGAGVPVLLHRPQGAAIAR